MQTPSLHEMNTIFKEPQDIEQPKIKKSKEPAILKMERVVQTPPKSALPTPPKAAKHHLPHQL